MAEEDIGGEIPHQTKETNLNKVKFVVYTVLFSILTGIGYHCEKNGTFFNSNNSVKELNEGNINSEKCNILFTSYGGNGNLIEQRFKITMTEKDGIYECTIEQNGDNYLFRETVSTFKTGNPEQVVPETINRLEGRTYGQINKGQRKEGEKTLKDTFSKLQTKSKN